MSREVQMSRRFVAASVTSMVLGGATLADVPRVAVDIAPVHSLASLVMQGVGTPDLIVPPGASPHGYSLRPAEAEALEKADIVFWIGEGLTPWLDKALDSLAANATITTLLEADKTILLDFREGALFEAHEHDDDHHDDHGDEDHAKHDDDHHDEDGDDHHDEHDDEHAHDDEGKDDHAKGSSDEHDEHAHGEHDPHAWLSLANAGTWLNLIASELSAADPDHAGVYFANAATARAELEVLSEEIGTMLDPVRGKSFVVFHDAYQYFETSFDFPAAGAISLGDASEPSPARLAEIRGRIRDEGVDCVLAEPQYKKGLVDAVLEGTDANTGVIDPLGAGLEPGPALYAQVIRNMASTLAECL